jgi:hypothetical protein
MKQVRIIFLISGAITVITLGVVVYMMLSGPDHIEWQGRSLGELLENGDMLGLVMIPIALLIVAFSLRPFLRIIFPDEIKNGVDATAKVLKVWDTGVSINDNPQVGLLLEVKPLNAMPFQVEAKTVVSRLNVALVQPGTTAEVRYDPNKPQRIRVLTVHVQGASAPVASTGVPSTGKADLTNGGAVARLEELEQLRTKGLISEAEYQQKRAEILKAL